MITQKAELTFKHNLKHGRHGWLRLTPAYSIRVVNSILEKHPEIQHVLDPFSGTGTTGLVCAENGIDCDLLDINPFLVWLAKAKTSNYTSRSLADARSGLAIILEHALEIPEIDDLWLPPISHIERWWSASTRGLLANIYALIHRQFVTANPARDLLLTAFCRLIIESSNAAFNHQSMSFKEKQVSLFEHEELQMLTDRFGQIAEEVIVSAEQPIRGSVKVTLADSRSVPTPAMPYDAVITSPPYPNRMSYIRELRPYMYWLGYINEAREAAELDWQAIGGTWGSATSRLNQWQPNGIQVAYSNFAEMIASIDAQSPLLANYVHKYFVDISLHITSVYQVLASSAKVFYIVGNSKFYDTLVPVEQIYASLFRSNGFSEVSVEPLRKRNSKKELVEYIVSAQK